MIKVTNSERNDIIESKLVCENEYEYNVFQNVINNILFNYTTSINSYLNLVNKIDNLENVTDEDEAKIISIIEKALAQLDIVKDKYIENSDEVLFYVQYDFETLRLQLEDILYVPKNNRVLH